jgi:DNA-binding CsgD family transcriptional regulator
MLGGDEILFRNAAAGRLMQQGVFAENARRLVRFSNPAAHGLLERVRRGKALAGTELLRSDGAQPPIIMQAMRLGRSTAGGARSDAPIVVVFIQLTAAGANRRRAIDTFTLFSRSERDVLARLVNGHSVEAIAKARNRAVATVRWHVKKMLMKSGARSIQDLTRMGALLAPF